MGLADALADLRDAYPRQAVTVETLRVFHRELADLPPAAVEAAVREIIRTSAWFPHISEIRGLVAERTLSLPGENEALAMIEARTAWARRPEGERGEPSPLHPLVREALDNAGGFSALRHADKPEVIRGQFLRLYRELRDHATREAQTGDVMLAPAPCRKELH